MSIKSKQKKMNTILHFAFSDQFKAVMTDFVQEHYQDERKVYKKAWLQFRAEHSQLFEQEAVRLTSGGYDGDVEVKFYQAGRYYFRKKLLRAQRFVDNTVSKSLSAKASASATASPGATGHAIAKGSNALPRYIAPFIAEAMERHIQTVGLTTTPALAYDDFHRTHALTEEHLWDKLKKTYKNRYQRVKRHLKNLN